MWNKRGLSKLKFEQNRKRRSATTNYIYNICFIYIRIYTYVYIYSRFLPCYGEELVFSQFNECSGFLPLISNPGADPSVRGFLCVLPQHRLGQLSTLPYAHQAEMKISLHLLGHLFCPGAALDYVVASRADDVTHSLGGVAVSLGGFGGQLQDSAGGSQRFCVHELAGLGRPRYLQHLFCSSLCCIFALQIEEGKKKNSSTQGQAAVDS
jgi:hypothetical protein